MSRRSGDRSGGFVLVNALVLVAALAGIAVVLLARAEGARARQAESLGAAQIRLYLDAFEALSLTLLTADQVAGATDHGGEAWARAGYDVALDRGRVGGEIIDLQGRFNVNWLANPNDPAIWESFHLLLRRLALSPGLADGIAGFLDPGEARDSAAYARQTPAIAPVGGPVLLVDQLLAVPALRARNLDRLRPYIAALPGDSTLNVNTAPAEVLQSMIPGLGTAVTDRLVQSRRAAPFVSMEDFVQRMAAFGATGGLDDAALLRFGIASSWFEAAIEASLEGRRRHRTAVFERLPLPDGVRVAYRLDQVP